MSFNYQKMKLGTKIAKNKILYFIMYYKTNVL